MALLGAYILPHPPLAVPAVGRGEERKIAATIAGCNEVARRIAQLQPDALIVISPHSAYYSDWIYVAAGACARGTFAGFGAPEVGFSLAYDAALREALIARAREAGVPAGCVSKEVRALDHGVMVPLHFIEQAYPSSSYRALSIGGSALPRAQLVAFGGCIARALDDANRRAVLVASGDLSHKLKADGPYGFDAAGPQFDTAFARVVESGDAAGFAELDPDMCEAAAECGLSGFIMLAGALAQVERDEGARFVSELLSCEGPFGVGYGVAAFERAGAAGGASARTNAQGDSGATGEPDSSEEAALSNAQEIPSAQDEPTSSAIAVPAEVDPLVALARATIDRYVREGMAPAPPQLPAGFPHRAACFVSIHTASSGDLRGCIGTIAPDKPTLAEEVIANAVSASTRDPRFPPITPDELHDLAVSVDVLSSPEPATVDMLDPQRYGVIVSQAHKRGLLLPDLDGVDTVEDQLRIACLKAGIDPAGGFDSERGIRIERFRVERHE